MVNEVESILNEIRERVRTDYEQNAAKESLAQPHAKSARGYAAQQALSLEFPEESEPGNSESLSRLSAHLTTTARAWDRLPPMYSNRQGGAARFELWIKARLKSMSRWFTWEQVNFNSAVHHALSETLQALSAYQQELAGLRGELSKEGESWREKFEHSDRELTALRASIEALTAEIRKRDAALEMRTASVMNETRAELTSRLTELAGELRESDQQLREEQRVCFKQLSLEESEAAVMEDRGRRVIESRLDKLEKALANGEQ
ncbi:MAG TPA: hypothetical protein VK582_15610 [Pyrinomonadaceae bacterium]|nr:hypothetical protein [Pyrinomonadaceae bacterium]